MDDFTVNAEKLVKEFRQKRAIVQSKRRKLTGDIYAGEAEKAANYLKGLELISNLLISALESYRNVFQKHVPELKFDIQVKNRHPENLEVIFSMNHYKLRFLTRKANPGETLQDVPVDGLLYCESSYKGGSRTLEAQVGLWSDIGYDAWGIKNDKDEFEYFMNSMLPDIIAQKWHNATVTLVHAHE